MNSSTACLRTRWRRCHRYIDEGAELAVCGAPVDSMASDAIAVLRGYGLRKPMLLAESGAVKPRAYRPPSYI